ncbi:MAG: enolase C-terminal domain-like protein [Pseudomonadota bacterium]
MTPLTIAFHAAFRHAGAERAETETVIVNATSGALEGIGEGCPRSYVTGESVASALDFFAEHKQAVLGLHSLDDIRDFIARFQPAIDANPAAWCAIELALLDLFGKEQQSSLETVLDLPPIEQPCRYSAILSAGTAEGFAKQLAHYQAQGFTQFKIKLSGDAARDAAYVACLRNAGISPSQVRADANRLWVDAATAIAYLSGLDYAFWAIEDPLHRMQAEALAHIAQSRNCRMILDEYFLRRDHFLDLSENGPWIINVRVSKMGGLLRSLAIIRHAVTAGIPVIVGAQVGETSILTRAGICAAHACKDQLFAQEGAFGNFLLTADPCIPSLTFGKAGILSLHPSLTKPGLGLEWQTESPLTRSAPAAPSTN